MADKPNKPQKLKARLPRGLADRGPVEIAATRDMVEKIRAVLLRGPALPASFHPRRLA